MAKRIIALMLSAFLIIAFAAPQNTAQASASVNGMIRVLLESHGAQPSVTVKLSGFYAVQGNSGISLTRNSNVTISASNGKLTLKTDSGTYSMGSSFIIEAETDSSGNTGYVVLNNTSNGQRSYKGHFAFYASGSYVKIVNIVYMEDYLVGVVGNEMDNAFPLEALKAQAVSARTYAYMMMKTSDIYDIVDTTNAQVYKGYRSSDTAVIRAVNETKGQLVSYNGKIIVTYYGASNGGETEIPSNAWSNRESPGAYVIKKDEFDVRNELSLLATVFFGTSSGKSNYSQVDTAIRKKAADKLGVSSSNVSVNGISSMRLTNPKYPGSINYQTLEMDLNVSANGQARSVTISMNVFTEIRDILGLQYNLRMARLTTLNGNYYLDYCRYGHGVGMSQRGAQQMGTEGYSYLQILGFYYVNTDIVTYNFTRTEPRVSNDADAQIGSALGYPIIATAKANVNQTLNVRSLPSTTAMAIGVYMKDETVRITAFQDKWAQVNYNGDLGYVNIDYLKDIEFATDYSQGPALGGDFTPTAGDNKTTYDDPDLYMTAIAFAKTKLPTPTSHVIIREAANNSSGVLGSIPSGQTIEVIRAEGTWYKVRYQATTGYIQQAYTEGYAINTEKIPSQWKKGQTQPQATSGGQTQPPTAQPTPTPVPELSISSKATAACKVYKQSSTTSTSFATLSKGEEFTVTAIENGMAKIKIGAFVGWIELKYASGVDASMAQAQTPASTPAPTASGSADGGFVNVGSAQTVKTNASVKLRSGAGTEYSNLGTIPKGASVTLVTKGSDWSKIVYSGQTGYCMTKYLTISQSQVTGTAMTTNASVNLRAGKGTNFDILASVPKGATVTVTENAGDWSQVVYDGKTGYIMTQYLGASSSSSSSSSSQSGSGQTAKTTSSVNLRQGQGTTFAILGSAPKGATVTLVSKGPEWSKVIYDGVTGYVMTQYLTDIKTVSGSSQTQSQASVTNASVNLREGAGTSYPSLAVIPKGSSVTVLEAGATWTYVSYGGKTGYIMNSYIVSGLPTAQGAESGGVPDGKAITNKSAAMREGAGSSYGQISTIPSGTTVSVYKQSGDWYLVEYGQNAGYVSAADISVGSLSGSSSSTQSPSQTSSPPASSGGYVTSQAVNLRSQASADSQSIAVIPGGTSVQVLEQGETWSFVYVGGQAGYMMSAYIIAEGSQPSGSTQAPSSNTKTTNAAVKLRSGPGTNYDEVASISAGKTVTVLEPGPLWTKVVYNGKQGYILNAYIN